MVVFPAFARPIIRTRNLISGSRGRSCCAAIVASLARKRAGRGAASQRETEVLSTVVCEAFVDGNVILVMGPNAHRCGFWNSFYERLKPTCLGHDSGMFCAEDQLTRDNVRSIVVPSIASENRGTLAVTSNKWAGAC